MSIVTFWNAMDKENAQTFSAIALATYMAMEHNFKILLIDTTFNDITTERAFWKKKKENKAFTELTGGKMDISNGVEGLFSAVASNKATPEIVINYTKIVFKNRLDVLLGPRTKKRKEYNNSFPLYDDLILTASKYYDLVLVDLAKGRKNETIASILGHSNLILYTMPPNLANIDNYIELKKNKDPIVSSMKTLPFLTRSDESSSYNVKNTTRYINEKEQIMTLPYNVRFMEAVNESNIAKFMTNTKLSKSALQVNGDFFEELQKTSNKILDKLKELSKMQNVV